MDDSVRLDVWLDVACLFKTRSEAQKACRGGKVDVNGQTAKPNRMIRRGDELSIGRPFGRYSGWLLLLFAPWLFVGTGVPGIRALARSDTALHSESWRELSTSRSLQRHA